MNEVCEFIEKLRHISVKHDIDLTLPVSGWLVGNAEVFTDSGDTNLELIQWVDSMCDKSADSIQVKDDNSLPKLLSCNGVEADHMDCTEEFIYAGEHFVTRLDNEPMLSFYERWNRSVSDPSNSNENEVLK